MIFQKHFLASHYPYAFQFFDRCLNMTAEEERRKEPYDMDRKEFHDVKKLLRENGMNVKGGWKYRKAGDYGEVDVWQDATCFET
jgi:hypothetical protein